MCKLPIEGPADIISRLGHRSSWFIFRVMKGPLGCYRKQNNAVIWETSGDNEFLFLSLFLSIIIWYNSIEIVGKIFLKRTLISTIEYHAPVLFCFSFEICRYQLRSMQQNIALQLKFWCNIWKAGTKFRREGLTLDEQNIWHSNQR